MKFDNLVKSIFEDFNVAPQLQMATNAGPDCGMTTGDMSNTFPSKQETVIFKSKKKKFKKKLRKD